MYMTVLIDVAGPCVLSDTCWRLKVQAELYVQIWNASVAHIPDLFKYRFSRDIEDIFPYSDLDFNNC